MKATLKVLLWIGVVVLVVAAFVIVALPNAKRIARDYLVKHATQVIEASSLPAAEKEDAASTVRVFFSKAVEDRIPQDKLDLVFGTVLGGPYGKLLQLTAVQRAIKTSNLGKEKQTEALDNLQILSSAYALKRVSDAEIAPVIEAIPRNAQGQPATLPWEIADLDRVVARVASIGGRHGKLIQIATAQRAIAKSGLIKKEKGRAAESLQRLSAAYARGTVSDAELAPVIEAIPQDGQGLPVRPPWNPKDLERVLELTRGIVATGRPTQPENPEPDFPDAIRQAVQAMKEALR